MNALFRSSLSTFVVLLSVVAVQAQQPVAKTLPDSLLHSGRKAVKKQVQSLNQLKEGSPQLGFLSERFKKKNSFDISGIVIGSGMQRIGNDYRATYSLEGQLSLFSIPIELQLSNNQQNRLFDHPLKGNVFKLGFDRQSLLRSMVPELGNYKQFTDQVFSGKSVSAGLRQQMVAQVKKGSAEQQQQFSGVYNYINQYGSVEELLKLDEAALRSKLALLMAKQKDSVAGQLSQKLSESKEKEQQLLDSLTGRVMLVKYQLEEQGIAPERIADIEKQLAAPKNLNTYIEKYGLNELKPSGWQGVLNRLTELEMGSFGEQLPGSFMNKALFLQGGSVTLQTRKGPLQLGLAASQDIGFTKDAGFNYSNFNVPKFVTFVSVPVVGNGFAKSRISWTGSIEKQSYRLNESSRISPRSGSALTLSQEIGSKKLGRFTFELSKSAAAFRNVGQIGSEQVLLERNSLGNYFRDDLFETMAFGVKYDLNDQKSRMNTNVFFNYSGIGFQNPAQQSFGNMGMRMGGSIRKGFLKNKVLLNLRGDLKNTPVSGTTDAHWQNHNLNLEGRFKLTRKFNFSIKYMDNGVQKSGEQSQSIYGSKKYQFDASSSYRLFKKNGFSHLVMGLQQMNNPVAQSSSQFLTSIYTQSLSLGTVTLMGNVFFNKELGQQNLLGDMVNADASVQYKFLQNISASTGGTYLDNTGQVRQLGIKQNLQFTAWKNFEVNLYADVRKNMVTPLYPELFANNRGEVSLKYYFR